MVRVSLLRFPVLVTNVTDRWDLFKLQQYFKWPHIFKSKLLFFVSRYNGFTEWRVNSGWILMPLYILACAFWQCKTDQWHLLVILGTTTIQRSKEILNHLLTECKNNFNSFHCLFVIEFSKPSHWFILEHKPKKKKNI